LQYIQQHKNDVAHPTKKQRQFSKGWISIKIKGRETVKAYSL
jgi:hypothetical protein